MKLVGNIKSYISDELITYMLTHKGIQKPSWEVFHGDNLPFTLEFPFTGKLKWWFSKLGPGETFPMHTDTFEDVGNKRYWIACQDYESGHIFVYKDTLVANYKAGDVFLFDDSNALHGAANISSTAKISLQIAIPINNDQDGLFLLGNETHL